MPQITCSYLSLGSAMLLGASLLACAPIEPLPAAVPAPPRIEVRETTYRHTVYFDEDRSRPDAAETAQLDSFLRGLPRSRGLSFVVVGHADERGPEPRNAQLADRRAAEIARQIVASGFDGGTVSLDSWGELAPVGGGQSAAAHRRDRRVDIAAELIEPHLVGCSTGSHDLASGPQNYPLPDHGCADLANIIRMVDNPRDLLTGRATSPADGIRESEAIVRYRTDKVRPLDDAEVSQ